jgi:hypothetical protein
VSGEYACSSDLWAEDTLRGATLRSPHPYARITSIDTGPALEQPGVKDGRIRNPSFTGYLISTVLAGLNLAHTPVTPEQLCGV